MGDCIICDAAAGKFKTFKIYEDDKAVAFLSERPVSMGHVIVAPRQHYPILEATPDYVVGHLLVVANSLSIALFSALEAQGTNILIQNGEPAGQDVAHLIIHIIPRYAEDGLEFQWQPRQLTEEQMSAVELALREQAKSITSFEKEKPKPIDMDKVARGTIMGRSSPQKSPPVETKEAPAESEQRPEKDFKDSKESDQPAKQKTENYLIRHLRRIP